MDRFRKIVEIASNLAIVLVALLLGYFMVDRYLASPAKPATAAASELKPGTKLPLTNVDFGRNDKNLLLVLSTACHFCTESTPFYERLIKQNVENKKLNIIASFPQEAAEAKNYLKEKNLVVDEVIRATPSDALVTGTPTLILTDKNGIVLQSWVGKLTPEKEIEVTERVFSNVQVVFN